MDDSKVAPIPAQSGSAVLEGASDNAQSLMIHFDGAIDRRNLLRKLRTFARNTGTVGWCRATSQGKVEAAVHHAYGLSVFLVQLSHWLEVNPGVGANFGESSEAEGLASFRIRREKLELASQSEWDYYKALGVDTESRQFPALHHGGLLGGADVGEVKTAREYWKQVWGSDIDPAFHIAFRTISGSFDEKVVPQAEYRKIWRALNPGESLVQAYSHKLVFSEFMPEKYQPDTVLSCVGGRFYDGEKKWIRAEADALRILERVGKAIIKPTDRDNGRGVELLEYGTGGDVKLGGEKVEFQSLASRYQSNFLVQELVEQHEVMGLPHSDSLNTLRVVTLRWEGKIHHLLTFARFGVDGRVNDNAGTGGLCVGVGDDGTFSDYGINEQARALREHPNSGVVFGEIGKIPQYSRIVKFAKRMHYRVPYFDLLSWDIAVSKSAKPILIECNFRGAVWLYQLAAGRPLFGDYTEDILSSFRR